MLATGEIKQTSLETVAVKISAVCIPTPSSAWSVALTPASHWMIHYNPSSGAASFPLPQNSMLGLQLRYTIV